MASADPATLAGTIAGRTMAPRPTLVATPALRYWRTQRALTQTALAERLAVAISTVQRLEAGGAARLSTVAKLAEVLGVTPADLMTPPTQTNQLRGAAESQADYRTDPEPST